MEEINAYVKRSRRRTLEIQVVHGGDVIIRAPYGMSATEIRRFVDQKRDWIAYHVLKQRAREEESDEELAKQGINGPFTEEDIRKMTVQARRVLTQKTQKYAAQIGVTYNRISIRHQKTRWGSCSSKGNLNYNCLLMLCPEEVQDYVVVHELCHRLEMNHSRKFWNAVASVLSDYVSRRQWLKEHGGALIERLPE